MHCGIVQLTQRINSSGSGERLYIGTSGNLQPRIQEHRVHGFRLLDNGHGVLVNTRQERIGSRKTALDRRADHRGVVMVVVFVTSIVIVDVDPNATATNVRAGGLSVGEQDTLRAADKNHQREKINAEYGHRGCQYLKGLYDFDKSINITQWVVCFTNKNLLADGIIILCGYNDHLDVIASFGLYIIVITSIPTTALPDRTTQRCVLALYDYDRDYKPLCSGQLASDSRKYDTSYRYYNIITVLPQI